MLMPQIVGEHQGADRKLTDAERGRHDPPRERADVLGEEQAPLRAAPKSAATPATPRGTIARDAISPIA